jgi:lipooligosaccharide transport system permease protein
VSSAQSSTTAPVPVRRVRRLEPAALAGVMTRDVVLFGRYWKATTFSSIVQPTIYLLAFAAGIGALVNRVGRFSYLDYVATGVVATAVLFSSAFPGMFNTFVRWRFQRTYDALLAAPVDVEELVTAEVLWIALRAGVYGLAPIVVGIVFGLHPTPGMLAVVPIGFLTGFGFASFDYVTSAVLTPMFRVAGTFFPITTLPAGIRVVAKFNPLYHCVQLVRDASLSGLGTADLAHAGVLALFAIVMWRLAIWRLGKRLID